MMILETACTTARDRAGSRFDPVSTTGLITVLVVALADALLEHEELSAAAIYKIVTEIAGA